MTTDERRVPVVLFHGLRLLMLGEREGPLATQDNYEHGRVSYAHLFADGRIMRYGEVVGRREDLQFTGEVVTPERAHDYFDNMTLPGAGGWPF